MAVGMQTGAPWVMCKEDYAPDPMINAFNGFYGDAFSQNKPYKPTLWTGAWSDRSDGNSLKLAKLLLKNNFNETFAIKGGVRGTKDGRSTVSMNLDFGYN